MIDLNAYIPHVWLVIAVIGLGLAVTSLISSVKDFRTTKPTNGFRILAIGDIVQESLRVVLYLVFAGLGVFYLWSSQEVNRSGVGWLMVGAELILIAKTLVQLSVNRYLRRHHVRVEGVAETQDQREDREFGEQRRELETIHVEESNGN